MADPNDTILKVRRNIARAEDAARAGKITRETADALVQGELDKYKLTLDEVRGVGTMGQGEELRSTPGFVQRFTEGLLASLPDTARMAGGMFGTGGGAIAGGALGVPAGPPGVVGGAVGGAFIGNVLGAELAGQAADLAVDFVKRRIAQSQGLEPAPHKGAGERMYEASWNMITDATMMGLGGELSYLSRRTGLGFRNFVRNERAVEIGKDLAAADVSPKGAALMAGSKTTQGAIELQRGLPWTSDIHQKAIQETWDDIARYADDVSRLEGGTAQTAYRAGEGVQGGIERYAVRSRAVSDQLYQTVRGLDGMATDLRPLKQAAAEMQEELARGLKNPAAKDLVDQILARPDEVDFLTARTLRSHLAETARDMAEGNRARGFAKRLVSKADEVVESAGKAMDPDGLKGLRKANEFYKERAARLDRMASIRNSEDGIEAWNRAIGGTNRDPSKLLIFKKTLANDEWSEFVSARIHDMGLETKGQGTGLDLQFNAERFLSSFREMAPDVKDVMFGKNTPLREGVDRLARFGSHIRDARTMSNPGGTGSKVGTYLTVAGAGRAITTAAGLGATYSAGSSGSMWPLIGFGAMYGSNVAAAKYLFTNPRFVNWMTEAVVLSPRNYAGMAAQITRLHRIVKDDPESAPYIQQYLQGLSEAMARKAVSSVISGDAEGQTAADQARKPLSQRFSEQAEGFEDQRAVLARMPEADAQRWRKGMRNEAAVMRFYRNAQRDVAQIDARLAELERNGGRNASRERGTLERQRARLMNEALDFSSAVYGG